jgi:hypothetical protein
MCCDNTTYSEDQINGKCSACGSDTVDGQAYDQCAWSPVLCEECGCSPCDGSC